MLQTTGVPVLKLKLCHWSEYRSWLSKHKINLLAHISEVPILLWKFRKNDKVVTFAVVRNSAFSKAWREIDQFTYYCRFTYVWRTGLPAYIQGEGIRAVWENGHRFICVHIGDSTEFKLICFQLHIAYPFTTRSEWICI